MSASNPRRADNRSMTTSPAAVAAIPLRRAWAVAALLISYERRLAEAPALVPELTAEAA
jgi:hypothetical protein